MNQEFADQVDAYVHTEMAQMNLELDAALKDAPTKVQTAIRRYLRLE